mmetsp:Transcript_2015/g.2984  ORF Transcript_2015/g.2984 Transcript_2015/m.2984 type:complete len:84 (+) Transcript_2015:865-1116(+)
MAFLRFIRDLLADSLFFIIRSSLFSIWAARLLLKPLSIFTAGFEEGSTNVELEVVGSKLQESRELEGLLRHGWKTCIIFIRPG